MTEPLSPVAQAVMDGFNREAKPEPYHQREAVAAALEAAADQVVPVTSSRTAAAAGKRRARAELLAIAAELKNHHD